jgi:hypothetical protein
VLVPNPQRTTVRERRALRLARCETRPIHKTSLRSCSRGYARPRRPRGGPGGSAVSICSVSYIGRPVELCRGREIVCHEAFLRVVGLAGAEYRESGLFPGAGLDLQGGVDAVEEVTDFRSHCRPDSDRASRVVPPADCHLAQQDAGRKVRRVPARRRRTALRHGERLRSGRRGSRGRPRPSLVLQPAPRYCSARTLAV